MLLLWYLLIMNYIMQKSALLSTPKILNSVILSRNACSHTYKPIHTLAISIHNVNYINTRLFMSSSSVLAMKQPDEIEIPMDKISIHYARSSGPGGQNVNKLNTKAEARFHVDSAEWLPYDVRQRLKQYQINKINKDGDIIVTAQEHRTQGQNKKDCIQKLKEMIAEAYMEPKEREIWVGISEKTKAIRREDKRRRSDVKASRRSNHNFDD